MTRPIVAARIAAGMCSRCLVRAARPDRAHCAVCAAADVARREQHRAEQRCMRCGNLGCDRFANCLECRRYLAEKQYAARLARRGCIPRDPTAADRLAEEVLP
jgi:hypothetical protein